MINLQFMQVYKVLYLPDIFQVCPLSQQPTVVEYHKVPEPQLVAEQRRLWHEYLTLKLNKGIT